MSPQAEATDRELLRRELARFARERLAPQVDTMERSRDGAAARELVGELRELGLLELALSAERGGGDGHDLAAVLDEMARVSAAPASLLLAHSLAQRLVVETGARPALEAITGEGGTKVLAHAIYAQPGDRDALPQARTDGDALVVEGGMELVVGAPVADLLVVAARRTEDDGLELALVPVEAPGVSVGPPVRTLGMRGCPTADVSFEHARVDSALRIAAPPRAEALLREVAQRARGAALAIAAGVTARSTRTAVAYAREREQGGRPIGEHPQVRAMLEDMVAARALCHDAAARLSADAPPPEPEATGLFVRAREAAARACSEGVQLLGGYGYMEDYGQERCMRDAKQAQQLLGRGDALRQEAMSRWLADGG